MILLAELQPLDTIAGSRKMLRASSANDPAVTGLNNVIWRPAISEEAVIGIRLFKGDFDGEASPAGANLSVQIDQWLTIEPNVRKFLWAGASVKLYAGVSGQAWPWPVVMDGVVDGFSAEGNKVKLQLKVNTEPFEAEILTLKYAGTGGAEGGIDLKEKTKPWLLGRCFNVEPILINSVDNVLQFSAYGAIQAVNVLYERGSDFGPSIGNYANYAALVAASIPPGKWATCLAEGMVRLGAPPYGVITGDVDGDNVGGTWWRKTGEIITRVATNAGVSGGQIEGASFTALDTALAGLSNQGRIGVFIDSQETLLEFASRLAAPCNAQVGVSLVGKLFVGRVAIGSPVITLDAQQRQLPRVTSSQEVDVSPPFSYLEMGYARSWRLHSVDEIAGFDSRMTVRFPEAPPAIMQIGAIYINATNKQFRYVGPTVYSDEGDAYSDEGLITSSGYEDIQDGAISTAQESADAAAILANTAQASADVALAAASAANAAIALIDDDNILSISEKVEVLIPGAAAFEALYTAVLANATAASVSVTTLNTKRTAWLATLTAITPAWNDTSVASPIVRGVLDTARSEYDAELKNVQRLSIEAMTAAKATDLTGNFAWAISGDVTGAVSTALPHDRRFTAMEGTTDKSPDTDFQLLSITTGLVLTVNNTVSSADRGVVTMGAGTTNGGTAILKATFPSGAIVERTITVTKTNAIPATGGGTGATFAQDTSFTNITGTSHAAISDELICRSNGSSQVRVAVDLNYSAAGGTSVRTPSFKASYATTPGGSLTDLFSEASGSSCIGGTEPEDGYYVRSEAVFTLPAPNTDYYFKLQGRRSSGTGNISFNGTSFTVRQ